MTMTMQDFEARMENDAGVTRGEALGYGEPTDDELSAINKMTPRPLARSDLFVVDTRPSDTSVDSHRTHMDPSTTLRNFADDAQAGVPILNSHGMATAGYADLPIGRSFGGQVLQQDVKTPRGVTIKASVTKPALYALHYLPRGLTMSTTSNDDLIRALDTGILPDVSVTFSNVPGKDRGTGYWYRCDECGNDLLRGADCTHFPGQVITKDGKTHRVTATVIDAGLQEYSHVWRGSNPKAKVPTRLLNKATDLVTRGILSHADVEDIDRDTGRHMAAALDWQALKGANGRFMVPTSARQTDQQGTVAATDAPAFNNPPSGDEDARRRQILDDAHNEGGAERGNDAPPPAGQAANDALAGVSADTSATLLAVMRDAGITLVGAQSPVDALRVVVEERDTLRPLAEDGRTYRADLVDLYHRAGVRAYGGEYNRERHERAAGAMTTTDLLGFIEERNDVAKRLYGKDMPGAGDTEAERLRGGVKDAIGGRQTTPADAPPTRGAAAEPDATPRWSDADAKLYEI